MFNFTAVVGFVIVALIAVIVLSIIYKSNKKLTEKI